METYIVLDRTLTYLIALRSEAMRIARCFPPYQKNHWINAENKILRTKYIREARVLNHLILQLRREMNT